MVGISKFGLLIQNFLIMGLFFQIQFRNRGKRDKDLVICSNIFSLNQIRFNIKKFIQEIYLYFLKKLIKHVAKIWQKVSYLQKNLKIFSLSACWHQKFRSLIVSVVSLSNLFYFALFWLRNITTFNILTKYLNYCFFKQF